MALSAAAPVEYSLLVHARVGLAGAHVEVDAVDERDLDVDAGAGYAAELAEALDHRGLLLLDANTAPPATQATTARTSTAWTMKLIAWKRTILVSFALSDCYLV